VGQGLCGTWLSYFLEQEKRDFIILDPGNLPNASRQAGGLINPVTGRRLVTTWLIDELLPFAHTQYTRLSQLLFTEQDKPHHKLIEERNILQFFAHPDTRVVFEKRVREHSDYLHLPTEPLAETALFNSTQGHGIIQKSCQIRPDLLLSSYKKNLLQQDRLVEKKVDYRQPAATKTFHLTI
jgi:hypothetical protein